MISAGDGNFRLDDNVSGGRAGKLVLEHLHQTAVGAMTYFTDYERWEATWEILAVWNLRFHL